MDVEGVCEGNQSVNDDHIIEAYAEKAHRLRTSAPESEREQHNGEYRDAVRGERYEVFPEMPRLVTDPALFLFGPDDKFIYAPEA